MTTHFAQFAALALAAVVTTATVVGTNAIASQQFTRADAVAQPQGPVEVVQRVVIIGHRV